MSKIISILAVLTLLISCNKNTNKERKAPTPQNVSKKEKEGIPTKQITEEAIHKSSKVSLSTNQLNAVISEFKNCKATSTKRNDCRNTFTKFISTTYKLDEFKNKNGTYEIYDSIQPIISKSKLWEKIGVATNQQNINKAVELARSGKLALIIDTSNTYGQVVMVQAGETKKSGSWGLKLPNVVSLANHSPTKSFQGKSLAYAFKKSENLQIYTRK